MDKLTGKKEPSKGPKQMPTLMPKHMYIYFLEYGVKRQFINK